jgi:hypothetical protein
MNKWMSLSCSLLLTAAGSAAAVADGVTEQTMAVMGQTSTDCSIVPLPFYAERPVIAGSSARLQRGPNGITASVSMPTPEPGTYCYPPATLVFDPAAGPAVPGHPEAFSLWAIYFNEPENCSDGECGVDDVLVPENCAEALGGAMALGGHIVGGPVLHLSGHLSVGDGPLGPLGCAPLLDADAAEIHLAVAPHGLLRPRLLPDLISTPPGGGPGYWYPAVFEAVE